MMKNLDLVTITDYIVGTVQSESIESGFQYQVDFEDIENRFGIALNDVLISDIDLALAQRIEVADVELIDNTFDVVLFTDYAPNYDPSEFEHETFYQN